MKDKLLSFIIHQSAFIVSRSSYHEPRRRDDGARFGVVVVVELRGRGEGAQAVARGELELEARGGVVAAGPDVEDEAVWEHVVAVEADARRERAFERGAVNPGAGRQT